MLGASLKLVSQTIFGANQSLEMQSSHYKSLVIKLHQGKFWVARTANVRGYENSLKQGTCTNYYIKKYGYHSILAISSQSCHDLVVKLMREHGLENVRGTAYHTEKLTLLQRKRLEVELAQVLSEQAVKKTLYVLRSNENRYYVRTTTKNIKESFKHKCIYQAPVVTPLDKENMIKTLMLMFGVNSVGGGSHVQPVFDKISLYGNCLDQYQSL